MPKVTEQHKLKQRRIILEAASICCARYGIQQTTIEKVKQEAGVSNGCIFLYFSSLEDLLSSAVVRTVNQVADYIDTFAPKRDDPIQSLLYCFHLVTMMDHFPDIDAQYRIFHQIPSALIFIPSLREKLTEPFSKIIDCFIGIVKTAKGRGILPPEAPENGTANLMLLLLEGFIKQRINYGTLFNEAEYKDSVKLYLGNWETDPRPIAQEFDQSIDIPDSTKER